ncbi:MAG: hypothetical protein LBT00_12585 [Spirochaetaceae bacterium]|nr:hypothetical protein [Spirochaetaceae bacterium]
MENDKTAFLPRHSPFSIRAAHWIASPFGFAMTMPAVIASGAKQSRALRPSGLLRRSAPRNDGHATRLAMTGRHAFAMTAGGTGMRVFADFPVPPKSRPSLRASRELKMING